MRKEIIVNSNESYLKNSIDFMTWLTEVAEEKIIEHRLLKKKFKSHDEFIIFTIIWIRVFKEIHKEIKKEISINKNLKKNICIDKYFKEFYLNQKDDYLGMTINAVTRESEIPRSTVKRVIEILIKKTLVKRNPKNLIIPTMHVRDAMKDYRQYIYKSSKKNYLIFQNLNLLDIYNRNDNF